ADPRDESGIAGRFDRTTGCASRLERMRALQLARDHFHRAAGGTQAIGDTTGQAAAAERHEDRIDVGHVLENFGRNRAVCSESCRIAYGVDVDTLELRRAAGGDSTPPLIERLSDDARIERAQEPKFGFCG